MNLPKKTKMLFLGSMLFIALLTLIDFGFRVLLRDADLCVLNAGFAFGIAGFLDPVVIVLKVVLIGALLILVYKEMKKLNPDIYLIGAYITIALAGLTTLMEKVLFGNICDYIGLPGIFRLYVNLVDLLIVGAIMVIFFRLIAELRRK